jgi:hypothetical protein
MSQSRLHVQACDLHVIVSEVSIVVKCTVASNKFWSSMSFQNLVRLSQIKKKIPADYAYVNKVSKN